MNAVSKKPSARRRIREALVHQLRTIKKSGGYNYDVVDVHEVTPSMEQMKNFPSIVLVMGDEVTLSFDTNGATFRRVQKDLQVLLHCFLNTNDPADAQDAMIQDIERLIGEHFGLEHPDGQCTCFLAQIVRSRPFGLKVNKPSCGVTITLSIRYQQLREDPTVRA